MPFFEVFIGVFPCTGSTHHIDSSVICFTSAYHIIAMLLASISLTLLVIINIVVALFYNETMPVKEDALSRLESNFEINMLFYRMLVGIFSMYC